MYYKLNEAGEKLYNIWSEKYEEENRRLGGDSGKGEYVEGWSIIDTSDYIKTIEDECGLLVFGYSDHAIDTLNDWIKDYGKDDLIGYGIKGTLGDLKNELIKYFVITN